jgi:hypothetical protein
MEPVETIGVPCCKVKCLRTCGEENGVCRRLGTCGCLNADTPMRNKLFTVSVLVSIVAFVLQILIVCGTSTSNNLVKSVAWSTIDFENQNLTANLYIAAKHYVVELDGNEIGTLTNGKFNTSGTYGMDWDDASCNSNFNGDKYCEACKDASTGQVLSTYTGLLSGLGQISSSWTRRVYEKDYNCQKVLGVFTGILGILMNIVAVSSFYDSCVAPAKNHFYGMDADASLGPGMQCLVVSTIIKFYDVLVHIAVPTPVERTNATVQLKSVPLGP